MEYYLFSYRPAPFSLVFSRDADVGLDDDAWHHVCFTWSNTNGDYKFYKDGVNVGSGTGLNKGGKIASGGTTVIGQDQDKVGGDFDREQAFVGDVTEVNVWGTVLSESDIVAQYRNCHITQGSVNWWSQFKDGVYGGVQIIEPWPGLSISFSKTGSSSLHISCIGQNIVNTRFNSDWKSEQSNRFY